MRRRSLPSGSASATTSRRSARAEGRAVGDRSVSSSRVVRRLAVAAALLSVASCAAPVPSPDASAAFRELAAPTAAETPAEPIVVEVAAPSGGAAPRPAPLAAAEDEWRFTFAPYLWLATTTGDAEADSTPSVPIDLSFGNLLADFDFTFMFAADLRNEASPWALSFDSIYLRFQSERSAGDVTQEFRLLETDGSYRFGEGATGLELLGGVRWISGQMDIDVNGGPDGDGDASWLEPVVGLRWITPFAENWNFVARGDVGGLGVGPDSSWQALAQAVWTVSDRVGWAFGWRYFALDYSHADVDWDLALSGQFAGLLIRF